MAFHKNLLEQNFTLHFSEDCRHQTVVWGRIGVLVISWFGQDWIIGRAFFTVLRRKKREERNPNVYLHLGKLRMIHFQLKNSENSREFPLLPSSDP